MLLNGKLIEEVDESDLDALIGVASESQTLDFKEHAYPTYPDQNGKAIWDKVEFSADLSSFANAFGGWIICGMKERKGQATEVCGLGSNVDVDREIGRLQQAANSGIEPRIPTLKFHSVNLSDPQKSKALVIYVGRSFIGPHRVKETSRFHMRRSNGKGIEMNVDELRMAFNLSESLTERVKDFRKERVELHSDYGIHEDIPVALESSFRIILHSIPLTTLSLGAGIELSSFEFADRAFGHPSLSSAFTRHARFNFLGMVFPQGIRIDEKEEYFQVFRHGAVEYVYSLKGYQGDDCVLLNPVTIEDKVLFALPIILEMQRNLNIDLPFVIMLSLVGLSSTKFDVSGYEPQVGTSRRITRNRIMIPDSVLNENNVDLKVFLKSIFDIMWNTGGCYGSGSYQNGDWIRKNRSEVGY